MRVESEVHESLGDAELVGDGRVLRFALALEKIRHDAAGSLRHLCKHLCRVSFCGGGFGLFLAHITAPSGLLLKRREANGTGRGQPLD
jgi:hypothetical protein